MIDETSHTQNAAQLQLKSKTSVATGRRKGIVFVASVGASKFKPTPR